ncbi:MAG: hypothetical protein QM702_04420 [Rubrivivax sp.]
MSYVRAIAAAALAAALAFTVLQLRSCWIGEGESRVQARWDSEKAQAAGAAASAAADKAHDDLIRFRNAERNNDEQARLASARADRLAAARAESERLRDQLAERDAAAPVPEAGDPGAVAAAREASTERELLGRCQARYLGLAERAEELRDQVTGLQADARMCRGEP